MIVADASKEVTTTYLLSLKFGTQQDAELFAFMMADLAERQRGWGVPERDMANAVVYALERMGVKVWADDSPSHPVNRPSAHDLRQMARRVQESPGDSEYVAALATAVLGYLPVGDRGHTTDT